MAEMVKLSHAAVRDEGIGEPHAHDAGQRLPAGGDFCRMVNECLCHGRTDAARLRAIFEGDDAFELLGDADWSLVRKFKDRAVVRHYSPKSLRDEWGWIKFWLISPPALQRIM